MRFGRLVFAGVLLGLGTCVWLNLSQTREHADGLLRAANPFASPTSSPRTQASASPTPSPTPAVPVAGQAAVVLALYNTRLIAADPITDLVYGEIRDGKNVWAGFTTETLLAKYPDCKAGALGTLIRTKASPTPTPSAAPTPSRSPAVFKSPAVVRTPANQPFKKTIDGYVYSLKPPSFTCVSDQAGRNAIAAAIAALKNQALPTMVSAGAQPTPDH